MRYKRNFVFDEYKDKDFNKWLDTMKSKSNDKIIGYRAKRKGDMFEVEIIYSDVKPERRFAIKGNDGYYTGKMYTSKGNKYGLFDQNVLNARLYKHYDIAVRTIRAMRDKYSNCKNNLIVEEI